MRKTISSGCSAPLESNLQAALVQAKAFQDGPCALVAYSPRSERTDVGVRSTMEAHTPSGAFANWRYPESVTRRVSEGRAQRGVPPRSVKQRGIIWGAELSENIDRRTPSLTRRVTGSLAGHADSGDPSHIFPTRPRPSIRTQISQITTDPEGRSATDRVESPPPPVSHL